ncbi:MAG: hypothetical protein MI724_00160 [Spirochaetales bacterium]|nr:hypothetical protein [Spirochaetales bacterium]
MHDDQLLLGIDIGTTTTKAGLFTVEGVEIASTYRDYRLIDGEPGAAEQDPVVWWNAVCACTRELFANDRSRSPRVCSVGVGGANAIVHLDEIGRPTARAVMQIDRRPRALVDEVSALVGEGGVQRTGNRIRTGLVGAPTVVWMLRRGVHRHGTFLAPGGYVVFRLTGEATIDLARASTSGLFNIRERCWDTEIVDALGIPRRMLPPVYASDTVVGIVDDAGAAATGIPVGTPVVAGAMDTVTAGLGLGATAAGDAFLILGSIGRISFLRARTPDPDPFLTVIYPGDDERYLAMAPFGVAGSAVRWIRERCGIADLSGATVGARGALFLPYLGGQWCPRWRPDSHGGFFGLRLDHRAVDLLQALYEGIAYAIRENIAFVEERFGTVVDEIFLGGGVVRNPEWCRVTADTLGKTLLSTSSSECETRGAAFLAGRGIGTVTRPWRGGPICRYHPRIDATELYEGGFRRFIALRDALDAIY